MSTPSPSPVRFDRTDGVAEIVLAGGRGNPIDLSWADAFEAAVASIASEDRCVLLRAHGPDFCFGGDVGTFVGDDPGALIRSLADRLHVSIRLLDAVEVPVVTAVQGWATAAGMSLALTSDILLVGEGARFKTAYNALGLTADGGMTWYLPRRVPATVAADLLLTDRVLTADEALHLGLAARVVPDDALADEARALAIGIAGRSRPAAVAVKRLLRQATDGDLSSHLDAETDAIAAAAAGPDGREGVAAFLERRAPRFGHAGA
ncbi:enoyl-CoA hydratase/isomerase family protein [Nitriliruptor alkaliphilus]|uniref:enoyl-CoA hydratase/isomerase family protein n=1 Tax=Nitriliruptor alkaliphilus TaxID=427918 RepID=UPI000697D208|nr:enoyl-CoA hydratase-related protein [Nitriliruptor alkaliphilus]